MRFAVLVLVVAGFGCSTLLDVERAREVFRGTEEPTVPILVEAPALELPAPRGLRATSGQLRAIPLRWDPLLTGDVRGYVVERRNKKGGRFRRIGAVPGRFETRYVDRGDDLAPKRDSKGGRSDLGDGASYCYRVRTFDSGGQIAGAPDPDVCATTAWLPAAPSGLQAFSHQPREVALSWRAAPDRKSVV